MSAALGALLAMGVAGGILLAVYGVYGTTTPPRVRSERERKQVNQLGLRLALAILLALVTALAVRWPVLIVLTALFGFSAPSVFGANAVSKRQIARVEAVAAWVESLRDVMAGGARGLTQSIIVTADAAPAPIAAEVRELADRIAAREPVDVALRQFATAIGDPSADQVVIALLVVANPRQRFGALGDALSELAVSTRDRVKMRLRVHAGQARMRNTARFMVLWTLGFVGVMVVFLRDYLKPYDGVVGQLVLVVIGLIFAFALWLLSRLARAEAPDRFLREAGQ